MAKTDDRLITLPWVLLSEALALVAIYTNGSFAAAKELLLDGLREGRIRWIFFKQEGYFDESETYRWHLEHSKIRDRTNPDVSVEDRWWGFWVVDDLASRNRNKQVDIGWEDSDALCTASASELGGGAARYRLTLIRLHRDDVMAELRLAGLPGWEAARASPSAETDTAPPRLPTAKERARMDPPQWVVCVPGCFPEEPENETRAEYFDRVWKQMRKELRDRAWSRDYLERRCYELKLLGLRQPRAKP
jgi:hypothetical protein